MAKMTIPIRDRLSVEQSVDVESIQELLFGTSLELDDNHKPSIDTANNIIHIFLKSVSKTGKCPCCGKISSDVNSIHFRHPQWMPINGMTAYAHISLKRYICNNKECSQRTFVEQIENVRRDQHRSDLLNLVIFSISIFCSDIVTSLICKEMGILISHDSANRMLNKLSIEDDTDIEIIGVDDVSLRKGQTYHTVIYDGNDHHLLALLDGRDGKALKEWLKIHPKVSIIARDRASAYAHAITEILPNAIQVADRFHILQNLIGYLNDIFKANMPEQIFIRNGKILDEPPEKTEVLRVSIDSPSFKDISYDNSPPIGENGIIRYSSKQQSGHTVRDQKRAKTRQERYERIMRLRNDWNSGKFNSKEDLAVAYGMSTVNANRYLKMPQKEVEKIKDLKERGKHKTDMDDYMNIVYKMLRDDYDPAFVYSYILHIGYSGSINSLINHIKAIGRNNFDMHIRRDFQYRYRYSQEITIIRRFDILKYITMKDKSKMENTETAMYYGLIEEKYPVIKTCSDIWNDFYPILMGHDPDKLDVFLEKYDNSIIQPFINGIKMDIAPVKNAISTSVSSGFVEGGNCRYKATKRLMFGRSGINHLFSKTYATSIIMRKGKRIRELISDWAAGLTGKVEGKMVMTGRKTMTRTVGIGVADCLA